MTKHIQCLTPARAQSRAHLRRLAVLLGFAQLARAQTTPSAVGVTVRGEVYDSVHSAPLANATIMMTGSPDVAMSDGDGHFTFRSVSPGPHVFTAYHSAIDSVGFAALSARVDDVNEQSVVRLALPSFRTLWRRTCRAPFAADSAFVAGIIRDAATHAPVGGAQVEVAWIEPRMDSTSHLRQTRWRLNTVSDSTGAYAVCGLPRDAGPSIRATRGAATSGTIDMLDVGEHVLRRDLFVAVGDPTNVGTVAGTISNPDGSPFADARVLVEGVPEVRSGRNGRFTLSKVPAGTREVEVLALGATPRAVTVNVFRGDTAILDVTLRRVTTLDVVRVLGSASQRRLVRGIEDRKKIGFGHYVDSTQMVGTMNLTSVLATFPSVNVQRVGTRFVVTLPEGMKRCVANLFVDGIRQAVARDAGPDTFEILDDLRPADIALVEVYTRGAETPMEFAAPWNDCGSIAVWTKWALAR